MTLDIDNAPTRIHRVVRRHNDWTLKEHEVLVSHWPDVNTIRRRLPHRTVRAIRGFAGKCNLLTNRHIWTAAEDTKLKKLAANGHNRKAIANELGLSVGQVAGRLRYTGTHIASQRPAPSADPLVDAVRLRAYEMKLSLADLDRSLGTRKIFQQAAGRQRVKLAHIQKAVRALGGTFTIVWDQGE